MSRSTYVAIVNPAAGGGRCGRQAPAALDRLRKAGLQIDVYATAAPGNATVLAREAFADGFRDFIAVGGDGTTFEIINGLFPKAQETDVRPSIGFLPLGTGNSFLRDFTSDGAAYSIQALTENRKRPCDIVRVKHQDGELYFINIFSFGFVADVAALRNRRFHRFGQLGYVLGVVTEVTRLQPHVFSMKIDRSAKVRTPVTFTSINNSRFTGGKMMMAPKANTSDGYADFVQFGAMGRYDLLRTFPKIFKGTHTGHRACTTNQVKEIDFYLDHKIDVMVDGEVQRLLPQRLEVLPNVLDVRT